MHAKYLPIYILLGAMFTISAFQNYNETGEPG